jgi:hypothetical protein
MPLAHRLSRCLRHATLPLCLLAAAPLGAQTVSINFDELPSTANSFLPTNYQGLNWASMGYTTTGVTPWADQLCRSGNNCAYANAQTSIMATAPITFSGWVRSWANNVFGPPLPATALLIEAINAGGTVLGSQTLSLTSAYQQFTVSQPFSRLRLTATPVGPDPNAFIQVDDVVINPAPATVVPEPSTYAMLATGLIGVLAVRRRRVVGLR